jgi:thiamine-monophosphate kinase
VQSPNSGEGRTRSSGGSDEFDAIDRMNALFMAAARVGTPEGGLPPAGEVWIGDDAAVVAAPAGSREVLTTDLVVEHVHFDLRLCSLGDVGFKALMVAASDLAAMGARSDHALVSIVAPPGLDLDALASGLAAASSDTGCVIVGGDLSGGPLLVVSVAVSGGLDAPSDRGALLRSGAGPGDHLFVTGPLGGSAAGHRLLLGELEPHGRDAGSGTAGLPSGPAVADGLVRAFRRPRARLGEGRAARRAGASAAIDVSDGLAADIGHLSRASGVGIALDTVPVVPGATEDEALHGGEDYELVVATPDPDRLGREFESAGMRPPVPIGRCTDPGGSVVLAGTALPADGWVHRF